MEQSHTFVTVSPKREENKVKTTLRVRTDLYAAVRARIAQVRADSNVFLSFDSASEKALELWLATDGGAGREALRYAVDDDASYLDLACLSEELQGVIRNFVRLMTAETLDARRFKRQIALREALYALLTDVDLEEDERKTEAPGARASEASNGF